MPRRVTGSPTTAACARSARTQAPHFPAKARHVGYFFMNGGPSQVDTFEPQALLDKHHGKPLRTAWQTKRQDGAGACGSPYKFRSTGSPASSSRELFAKTAEAHIDGMAIIRSMYADVPEPRAIAFS